MKFHPDAEKFGKKSQSFTDDILKINCLKISLGVKYVL